MSIIKIQILKDCKDPSGRNKSGFTAGRTITFSGEKVKIGEELIKSKKAKQLSISRTVVSSLKQANEILEKSK